MRTAVLVVCLTLAASLSACGSASMSSTELVESASGGAVAQTATESSAGAEDVQTPESAEAAEITDPAAPEAFFGTKGVEITIKNLKSEPLYTWLRRTGDVRTLKQNESTTFQGESSVGDDVEIKVTWRTDGGGGGFAGDLDGQNDTAAYPSVRMDWDETYQRTWFKINENFSKTAKLDGKDTKVSITRNSDSSDYKRFTVEIS